MAEQGGKLVGRISAQIDRLRPGGVRIDRFIRGRAGGTVHAHHRHALGAIAERRHDDSAGPRVARTIGGDIADPASVTQTVVAAALLAIVGLQIYQPDALPNGLRPKPRTQVVQLPAPPARKL